jgi:UDP-N-acetylglucosamine--N-acetylmuramyl-(pentapeptide) pyrophosphoryl-undecaprenol N-acetylglucosamine transferase
MAQRLGRAHLVIGRAGASTVCELAVAGRPSILIPLKIAADDHQTYNAEVLRDAKACLVIKEDDLTPERLCDEIRVMIEAPTALLIRAKAAKTVARPEAARDLADLVERTVKSRKG